MPRTTDARITSAFSRVQKQTCELLSWLAARAPVQKADLRRLKKEESQLSALWASGGPTEPSRFQVVLPVRRPASTGARCWSSCVSANRALESKFQTQSRAGS